MQHPNFRFEKLILHQATPTTTPNLGYARPGGGRKRPAMGRRPKLARAQGPAGPNIHPEICRIKVEKNRINNKKIKMQNACALLMLKKYRINKRAVVLLIQHMQD